MTSSLLCVLQANSLLLLRWLETGPGCVAQALRVKLASEHSLDPVTPDHVDGILNVLHGRDPDDVVTCRADGLRLIKLAERRRSCVLLARMQS